MALRLAHRSFKRLKRMASTCDSAKALRIIWMDLEMTGLDVNTNRILEAACIITDSDLNTVAKMPSLVIHESDEVLNNMNKWCIEHHGMSGLTEACRKSNLTLQDVETKLLSFVSEHTLPSLSPLAGNSVHADKRFIEKYMPRLAKHFHYRIIDVSTVKELCRRWYPDEFAKLPPKKNSHRALEDIEESIKELRTYRKLMFKAPGGKSPDSSSC